MTELQEKCDELEAVGVLAKTEQVNTTVKYHFLSKKQTMEHTLWPHLVKLDNTTHPNHLECQI